MGNYLNKKQNIFNDKRDPSEEFKTMILALLSPSEITPGIVAIVTRNTYHMHKRGLSTCLVLVHEEVVVSGED
jgi:hypothetical protein